MRKLIIALLVLALPSLSWAGPQQIRQVVGMAKVQGLSYTSVFSDDFNRADSGTVGGSWDSETDVPTALSISGNKLLWTDTSSTGSFLSKALGSTYYDAAISVDVSMSSTTVPNNRNIWIATSRAATVNDFILVLGNLGTTINSIRVGWNNEAGTTAYLSHSYTFVAGTEYTIRLEYGHATGTGLSDGYYTLYVNGVSVGSSTTLNNYGKFTNNIRVGPSLINNWGSDQDWNVTFDNYAFYEKN